MKCKLVVHTDHAEYELSVPRGVSRIGSAVDCEICISHDELPPHAANIDCRADACLLENRSPYELFLGDETVQQRASRPWQPGQVLSLTQNVSVALQAVDGATRGPLSASGPQSAGNGGALAAADAPAKKPGSQMTQAAVIVGCLVLGAVMLFKGPEARPETTESFAKLVKDLTAQEPLSRDQKVLLRYFQEAWMADRRQGPDGRRAVIRAYQQVLNFPAIREVSFNDPSIEGRIKLMVSRRLSKLGS